MNRSLHRAGLVCLCVLLSLSLWAQQEQRDGYTCESVDIQGAEGLLLVPQGIGSGPLPAVLLLHDHGAHFSIGKEKLIRPLSTAPSWLKHDAAEWVAKCLDGAYVGDSLARAGYVVLAVDAPGWGSRMQHSLVTDSLLLCLQNGDMKALKPLNKYLFNQQESIYHHLMDSLGHTWFEETIIGDKQALDFLCSLPVVDTTKIVCFGFSMGACRSWALAAADTRIAACAYSNWMTTRASLAEHNPRQLTGPSSFSMRIDGAFPGLDYPEVAAQIAPRHQLMMVGENDHLFTKESMDSAAQLIRLSYADSPCFEYHVYPVPHFFSHAQLTDLISWLNQVLLNK